MQFTRGAAVLAAAALLTTGLAACGEDEPVEPTSSSTVSPLPGDSTTSSSGSSDPSSSTSSASSSDGPEMPSDLPEAAREETKEGAAAFGKYYYETLGEAGHSGETTALEQMDTSDCKVCSTAIESINEEHAKGWSRDRNPYSVSDVKAVRRPDTGYKVSMNVKVAAHNRVDSNGEPNAKVKATEYTLTEHLIWQDGRWQMADWVAT